SGQTSTSAPALTANVSSPGTSQGTGTEATPGGNSPATAAPGIDLVVERPVRVELRADRIVVGGSSAATSSKIGRSEGRTILLSSDPGQTSAEFTQAVRDHVSDWG